MIEVFGEQASSNPKLISSNWPGIKLVRVSGQEKRQSMGFVGHKP
jgi:hypothetical protein